MNFEELFAFNSATFGGLLPFAAYLVAAVILLVVFKKIYTIVTPYCEYELIKNGNQAAAWSFGGAVLGFAIPMAEAVRSSHSLIDFAVWGVVAMIVQIVLFYVMQRPFPKLVARIRNGEVQMGVYLALTSIAAGLLNAACMSN
ncbi:DUF350 domain-containing protein [Alteromonas macleodii]|uniref:DUF350 domain-containing protein n=1 Tax=Alteromonas macleodii TaxID=28108 RepID=UPI0031401D98|tara:strand:- start:3486 stop:3914 length:429 start_codon:yes stop_codon:yes gene_type:complete